MWTLHKDILGFTFNSVEKTLWLEQPKCDALLTILYGWIRATREKSCGIPFVQFQLVTSKLRHTSISIPAGKCLFSPWNSILRKEPPFVTLHRNHSLFTPLRDSHTLLWKSTIALKNLPNWSLAGQILVESKTHQAMVSAASFSEKTRSVSRPCFAWNSLTI